MFLAALVTGCGGAGQGTGPTSGAADCPVVLTFDGRSYTSVTMDEPVPAGQPLGTGTELECDDIPRAPGEALSTYDVDVTQVLGVPAQDAVASGRLLYVRVDPNSAVLYDSRLLARADELMAKAREAAGPDSAASETSAAAEARDCVEVMTTATLAGRAFGFDGTVLSVVPAAEVDEDAGDSPAYPLATFEVHKWFAGGDGGSVEVKIQREVAIGERLLVSGEPLFGGDPLDDPIAWECGFTVEHSDATADNWRTAW